MSATTRLFLSGICMLVIFSCKKTETPPPPPPQVQAATVDDIAGDYIGQQRHHKIDYVYTPGVGLSYYRDTTYTTVDTLKIEKLSADSFRLSANDWQVYGKPLHFAFDTANVYSLKSPYGSPGWDDTIMLRFNTSADSLIVEKWDATSGTSAYHRYANSFRGKK